MYANQGFGSTPGGQPPESGGPPQPGPPSPPPRGGRRFGKVAALIVTCAVVAGGAYAVTEALAGPGTPASPATASGPTGQAAVLNGALADAASVSATQGTSGANSAAVQRLGRALIRLRRLGGMYGQFTFETKTGPRTLAFERGTILSIAGSDLTVKASDGATETWVLTGTTIVRENGSRTSSNSLADGQLVFTAGPVTGTARDARLVVIRSAAKSGSASQSA